MNGMHDSHKRTSISQLLNPLGTSHESSYSPPVQLPSIVSSTGISQYQHAPQPSQGVFSGPVDTGSSFHLRAASWDHVPDDQGISKRKGDGIGTMGRQYHMPPHNYADVGDHGHRQVRSRMDDSGNFGITNSGWPQPEGSSMSYGPMVAPMYSDERTALSGDYTPKAPYGHPHQYHEQQQISQLQALQADRASGRLGARGATSEPPQMQHRYSGMPQFFSAQAFPALVFQHPPQPPPPAMVKRPSTEVDDSVAPKKKQKTSKKAAGENANGSSKRGYNAKKRNEAAQIAAQNAQLMPTVSYAQAPGDKGKDKNSDAPMRIVAEGSQSGHPEASSGPLHPELQFARCMSNRYRSEQFPRCVSCTRRWAGDTCRFQGIRFFLKDSQRNIVGISFVENQKADSPTMNFPVKWNVPLEVHHIRRIKRTIANALLPTLRQELDHLNFSEVIRRTRESDVRATCDTCMTSIFSSSWMCRLCGREACAECFEQVKDLTEDRPGAGQAEIAALQVRRDKHAHTNPFFLSCTRRNEHHAKDFSPMSRFCKAELAQAIKDMEVMLLEPDVDALPVVGAIDPSLNNPQSPTSGTTLTEADPTASNPMSSMLAPGINGTHRSPNESDGTRSLSREDTNRAPATPAIASGNDSSSSATSEISQLSTGGLTAGQLETPSHPTTTVTDSDLSEEIFRPLWAKGYPIVVTGLLPKFRIPWTPEYFIEKYNTQSCLILECQTDVNKRVTVGEFFSWFGRYEGRVECWKLKDWPPSTDFKSAFLDLFEDFSSVVPVPNYVRRDGALNIASHFPTNTVAPDLGPRMYNAMASFEAAGSKGSTRLHMDMADGVNVMTYASPTPEGKPGCAAWDLFRAEDADKLRQFLRKKFKGMFQHDPIHSQQFYLDSQLRKELYDMYKVKSHRVYQKPGEAVFIPAGCAHQVCNLADCVKVAIDFVSPENIVRCEKLTREFREQNQSMVWKEDVLQLRTMMWFAWLSCCRQEKEMNEP